MSQARIVLRESVLERGEQLLEVTKLGSLTELINVMFSRYGKHLEQTWQVEPISPTYAKAEPLPDAVATTAPVPETNFTFDEPLIGL